MADYGNAFDEKNYDERMKELTEGGADGEDFSATQKWVVSHGSSLQLQYAP